MTALDDSSIDIVNQAIVARQTLQRSFKHIRGCLQMQLTTALSKSAESRQEYLQTGMQEILLKVSETVIQVVHQWHERESDCYFWPSYETISQPPEKSRISLQYDVGGPTKATSSKANCGYGHTYTKSTNGRVSELHRSTIAEWFNRLLTPSNDKLRDGSFFRPGGTHAWVSSERLVSDEPITETNCNQSSQLICLHVDCDPSNELHYRSVLPHRGFIDICLPPISSDVSVARQWGQYIAAVLNNSGSRMGRCGEQANHYFYPAEPWPALAGKPESSDLTPTLNPIRLALYSMWLAAVFDESGDWYRSHQSWVDLLLKEWKELRKEEVCPDGLPDLISRIEDGFRLRNDSPQINVKHWYTLHIEPTIAIKDQNPELGSAMLFSQWRLPHALLLMISSWVHKVFQSIRYMEGGIDLKESGQEATTRAMGHEIKHVAKAFRLSWLPQLDQILEVDQVDRIPDLSAGKIGRMTIEKSYAGDMAVVPFRSLFSHGSELIRLWCMSDTISDLPFPVTGNFTLQEFAIRCWQSALGAMTVHVLSKKTLSTRERIDDMARLREAIHTIYLPKLAPIIGGNCFPLLHCIDNSDPRPITLGRVLISVFTNCVRHGDPTVETRVQVQQTDSDRFMVTVSDFRRSRYSDSGIIAMLKNRNASSKLSEELIGQVLEAMRRADDSQSLAESGGFGQSVIRNLLKRWDGGIDEWPSRDGPDIDRNKKIIMQFHFYYPAQPKSS